MGKKERIDNLLIELGFFSTIEKARTSVMAGLVYVNNERIIKPGEKVDVNMAVRVKQHEMPYVSRGGYKLEKAIRHFSIDLNERIMIDIGSSTGGFTDCALQNGAKLVYALDVGTNQLDWKLRSHQQVVVMERTNFRHATKEMFNKGLPNFASIDVSFISLKLILPVLYDIMNEGEVVALIKPQFEANKEDVGKKGIVKDLDVHIDVVTTITEFSQHLGFNVSGLTYSPIKGSEGNIEFLIYLIKRPASDGKVSGKFDKTINIKEIVKTAHEL